MILYDLPSKTLMANFAKLFVFCGVALDSSFFFNSILALPNHGAETVSATL